MGRFSRTAVLTAAAATLAAPATASASEVRASPPSGGQYFIYYVADPSEVNDMWIAPRDEHLVRIKDAGALIVEGGWGCTTEPFGSTCSPGIGWAEVALAPLDRNLVHPGMLQIGLGPGDDRVRGEAPLFLNVQAGPGNDDLTALGTASFNGGAGADVMQGGPGGGDQVYYTIPDVGVHVTLDGLANDGIPGEGDNVMPSIENVLGTHDQDVLIGSDVANHLNGLIDIDHIEGRGGNDTLRGEARAVLDGGDGNDALLFDQGLGSGGTALGGDGADFIDVGFVGATVDAGPGDDRISARNSTFQVASTVSCGPGDDLVHADPIDTIAGDCENVVLP